MASWAGGSSVGAPAQAIQPKYPHLASVFNSFFRHFGDGNVPSTRQWASYRTEFKAQVLSLSAERVADASEEIRREQLAAWWLAFSASAFADGAAMEIRQAHLSELKRRLGDFLSGTSTIARIAPEPVPAPPQPAAAVLQVAAANHPVAQTSRARLPMDEAEISIGRTPTAGYRTVRPIRRPELETNQAGSSSTSSAANGNASGPSSSNKVSNIQISRFGLESKCAVVSVKSTMKLSRNL
jgi:hypothetical protein